MDNTIDINGILKAKALETRIFRLEGEIRIHLNNIQRLQGDNFGLIAQNDRLKQENDELKKILKTFDVGVIYG